MVDVIHGIGIFEQLWHRSSGQDGAPSEEAIWERTNTLYFVYYSRIHSRSYSWVFSGVLHTMRSYVDGMPDSHILQNTDIVTTNFSITLPRPAKRNVNRRLDRTFTQPGILRLPLRWRSRIRFITFSRTTESCVQSSFGCALWVLRTSSSEFGGVYEGRCCFWDRC